MATTGYLPSMARDGILNAGNGYYVQAIANVTRARVSMKNRSLSIVDKRTVVRAVHSFSIHSFSFSSLAILSFWYL
jgi:EamA domain-containing membrane protein RarD